MTAAALAMAAAESGEKRDMAPGGVVVSGPLGVPGLVVGETGTVEAATEAFPVLVAAGTASTAGAVAALRKTVTGAVTAVGAAARVGVAGCSGEWAFGCVPVGLRTAGGGGCCAAGGAAPEAGRAVVESTVCGAP